MNIVPFSSLCRENEQEIRFSKDSSYRIRWTVSRQKEADLLHIQVEDALKHPNWSMGRKMTIDSSTLVNKGLEVMEAKWLFGVQLEQIEVVVHPQSVIHSAVAYEDGAVIAQLGTPDMRCQFSMHCIIRKRNISPGEASGSFCNLRDLTFEPRIRIPSVGLKFAYEAMRRGGNIPTVFNAANEKAVAMFLDTKNRLSGNSGND